MAHLGAVLAAPAPRLGGEHHELLGKAACGLKQTLECACFLEMVEAAEGRDDALSDLFAVAVVFDDLDIGIWPADFGAAEHGGFSTTTLHIVPVICAQIKSKRHVRRNYPATPWHHIFYCSTPRLGEKARKSGVFSPRVHQISGQTVEDESNKAMGFPGFSVNAASSNISAV